MMSLLGADRDVGARALILVPPTFLNRSKKGTGRAGLLMGFDVTTSCSQINRGATGFRGINGALPAKRGSPPFIPRPITPQLTAVRDVLFEMRAIPPKNISRNRSWIIFHVSQWSLTATHSALDYRLTPYANGYRRFSLRRRTRACRPSTRLFRQSGC